MHAQTHLQHGDLLEARRISQKFTPKAQPGSTGPVAGCFKVARVCVSGVVTRRDQTRESRGFAGRARVACRLLNRDSTYMLHVIDEPGWRMALPSLEGE